MLLVQSPSKTEAQSEHSVGMVRRADSVNGIGLIADWQAKPHHNIRM